MKKQEDAQQNARMRVAFSARLNEALDDAGFPPKNKGRQVRVAKAFGVTQKGSRLWLEGVCMPRPLVITRMAAELAVRHEWLQWGLGPKRMDQANTDKRNTFLMQDAILDVDKLLLDSNTSVSPGRRAIMITSLYESSKARR